MSTSDCIARVFHLVPLAGIEPALLAELDFESSASTSSATGAGEVRTAKKALVPRDTGGL